MLQYYQGTLVFIFSTIVFMYSFVVDCEAPKEKVARFFSLHSNVPWIFLLFIWSAKNSRTIEGQKKCFLGWISPITIVLKGLSDIWSDFTMQGHQHRANNNNQYNKGPDSICFTTTRYLLLLGRKTREDTEFVCGIYQEWLLQLSSICFSSIRLLFQCPFISISTRHSLFM